MHPIPPKAESKFPQVNFKELMYPRLQNKALEVKQRDLLFSLTHGIYRNRARLFQQNRAEDNLCANPACRRENLVQDVEHLYCTCYKVGTSVLYLLQGESSLAVDKEEDAGPSERPRTTSRHQQYGLHPGYVPQMQTGS